MNILDKVDPSWHPILPELHKGQLQELNTKILPNISSQPAKEHIFRALEMPIDKVKVVILGQDPYPTPGNAIGYSFAVPQSRKKPKSLQIIEREILRSDILNTNSEKIDIMSWPRQGVLLLNSALTVETGKSGSHIKYWNRFTLALIRLLGTKNPCMWLLWGQKARAFANFVPNRLSTYPYDRETFEEIPMSPDFNYVMEADHPMVEEYGSGKFIGCDHFYFVNRMLSLAGSETIIW